MEKFETYLKIGNKYRAIPAALTVEKLTPGVYTIEETHTGDIIIEESKTTHDQLVNLPGTAYDEVMKDVEYFLTEECMQRFQDVKLLHKLNILLFGVPGGGKTCIVNRVAEEVIKRGGIVIFNPHPGSLLKMFTILNTLQPDTRVLVIFEELDQQIEKYEEDVFLHTLDGEMQKSNAMFIATTNYIESVPARIRRPGRFPIRIEVGLPNLEARTFYCRTKLIDTDLADDIAEQTEGFNIDQLKDVIRQHYCMKKELTVTISSLRKEFQIEDTGSPIPGRTRGKREPRVGRMSGFSAQAQVMERIAEVSGDFEMIGDDGV